MNNNYRRYPEAMCVRSFVVAFVLGGAGCGNDSLPTAPDAAMDILRTNTRHLANPAVLDALTRTEQAKITASDGGIADYFGASVAISGDTAIVGASYNDTDGKNDQGAAYVFVRSGDTWVEQAKLIADDGKGNDEFGISVALSGDTAIVGSWYADIGAQSEQGAAYVFVRNGTTWTQQAKLVASDGASTHTFGASVSLSSNTAIVGTWYGPGVSNSDEGAAYVFVRNGTTWTEQAKLVASDGLPSDLLGRSVSLSGETVIVGAPTADDGANTDQGSAYVFVRNGISWTQQAKLLASDGAMGDQFGWSVSLSGETALVGAYHAGPTSNAGRGAAYVFVRNGTSWVQQSKLVASDGGDSDRFGYATALLGDAAVIGSYWSQVATNESQGSAYLFRRQGSSWTEEEKLVASDGVADDWLGISAAISEDTAIVGAMNASSNDFRGSGYLFALAPWPSTKADGAACAADEECTGSVCEAGICCTPPPGEMTCAGMTCTGEACNESSSGASLPDSNGSMPEQAHCAYHAPSESSKQGLQSLSILMLLGHWIRRRRR